MTATDTLPGTFRDLLDHITDELAAAERETAPTLYFLRDAFLAIPGATADSALDAARILLAAHTRELAGLLSEEIQADRDRWPAGVPRREGAHHHRGGMTSARQILDRHADTLDEQAARGEGQ